MQLTRGRHAGVHSKASGAAALLAAALCVPAWSDAVQPGAALPALNSYAQPPFTVTGERTGGLAARFVAELNEELAAVQLAFRLEAQPRRRMDISLGSPDFTGLAMFLAPEFLSEPAGRRGGWSVPVMVDENLLVSIRPLSVPTLDALGGLRFGAITGHIYRMLGPLVEAGRIERADALDHVANLRKLCLDRVDFIVISRSELAGSAPLAACERPLHYVPFPQPQVIVRRMLVRMPDAPATQAVLGAVARVACGDRWRAALAQYGLATAGCAHRGR